MPKPPTKGDADGAGLPKSAAPRMTRSGTLATASSKKALSESNEPTPREQQAAQITEVEVDVSSLSSRKDFSTTIATLQPVVEALNKILIGDGSTINIIKGVFKYIRELETAERRDKDRLEIQAEVSSFRKAFKNNLSQMQHDLNHQLNGITATLNVTLETTEKALKVAEEIKGKTTDIICDVSKVTNAADRLADTTQSYRDALVSKQTSPNKSSVDPKVLSDMERKERQILVDIYDEEDACTMDKSLSELLDKANDALDKMSDGNKPEKVKVEGVHKTKRNAILLTLNSKAAAIWIREVGNEETFANAFSKGAHIRDREYNLIVPRVPLTFNPKKDADLREIEEANSLTPRVISKAKWIKPAERRRPGQTHAYAVLTLTSVDTANKLIRDGIGICNSFSRPTKQKQEPIQCMKCRRWGHFADKCLESADTCGTCGEKHRTSTCKSSNKLYCVSCADPSHASWDRSCPEFIRRCESINERNPVNNMPFFPSEQDWTLSVRPNRIPLEERFPITFAVNSLPPRGRKNQGVPLGTNRNQGSNANRRKDPHRSQSDGPTNPNNIPVPERNRYAANGTGADSVYTPPPWSLCPSGEDTGTWENEKTEGEVTQRHT